MTGIQTDSHNLTPFCFITKRQDFSFRNRLVLNISLHTAQALSAALTKIESYIPTTWVDYTEPDIDAEHLNHAEQAIMRVTGALNGAVDVINALANRVGLINSDLGNRYALSGGISIPINSDLNGYITPGNYYCDLSNVAGTLSNSPVGYRAFTLKAEYSTGNGFICQTIREYDSGKQYYRFLSNEGAWSPWSTPDSKSYKVNGSFEGDCNWITQPGIFSQLVSPNALNTPGYWSYITAYVNGEYVTQVAIGYTENNMSIRNNYNGWSAWRRL